MAFYETVFTVDSQTCHYYFCEALVQTCLDVWNAQTLCD